MAEVKLFVKNLPWSATEDSLYQFFGAKGHSVTFARLCTDRDTGRSRGFGFITYENQEGADSGLTLDGVDMDGRQISVSLANDGPRESRGPSNGPSSGPRMDRGPRAPAGACRAFASGNCQYGASCRFSHDGAAPSGGDRPARPAGGAGGQPVCYSFQKGSCKFGDSCKYQHVAAGADGGAKRNGDGQSRGGPKKPRGEEEDA